MKNLNLFTLVCQQRATLMMMSCLRFKSSRKQTLHNECLSPADISIASTLISPSIDVFINSVCFSCPNDFPHMTLLLMNSARTMSIKLLFGDPNRKKVFLSWMMMRLPLIIKIESMYGLEAAYISKHPWFRRISACIVCKSTSA